MEPEGKYLICPLPWRLVFSRPGGMQLFMPTLTALVNCNQSWVDTAHTYLRIPSISPSFSFYCSVASPFPDYRFIVSAVCFRLKTWLMLEHESQRKNPSWVFIMARKLEGSHKISVSLRVTHVTIWTTRGNQFKLVTRCSRPAIAVKRVELVATGRCLGQFWLLIKPTCFLFFEDKGIRSSFNTETFLYYEEEGEGWEENSPRVLTQCKCGHISMGVSQKGSVHIIRDNEHALWLRGFRVQQNTNIHM